MAQWLEVYDLLTNSLITVCSESEFKEKKADGEFRGAVYVRIASSDSINEGVEDDKNSTNHN